MQVSTNAPSYKADVVMSITATQKAIAEVKRLAEKRKAEGKTAPQACASVSAAAAAPALPLPV